MNEAERELCNDPPIDDDAVILHFMGSGASCQVYAKDIRNIAALNQPRPDDDAAQAHYDKMSLPYLGYELAGIIADVEHGRGFDATSLKTLKRVRAALHE